jgi:hypothetical protein
VFTDIGGVAECMKSCIKELPVNAAFVQQYPLWDAAFSSQ